MEVCSVTFDSSGATQPSGPATVVASVGELPVAPPDGYTGAIALGSEASLELEVDPGLLTPDVALELVLRVDGATSGLMVAGGLSLTLAPVPGSLHAQARVATVDGELFGFSKSAGYVGPWHRMVVAFTGVDLLFAINDAVTDRVVFAEAGRAAGPARWTFGGSPLSFELASIRWHAGLPVDLEPSAVDVRGRGDGEMRSLASRHPEFTGIEDVPETIIYSSRKISHPDAELIWHRSTGSHIVTGPIRQLWLEEGAERGQLGYPLTDVIAAAALCEPWRAAARPAPVGAVPPPTFDGVGARFEDGVVIADATRAIKVTGEILVCWHAHGGTLGALGAPTEPERSVADGLSQSFAGGVIYWHSEEGAHALAGPILEEYERRGGAALLGFPRADPIPAPEGGGILLTCARGTLHLPEGGDRGRWMSSAIYRAWVSAAADLGVALDDEVVRPSGVRVLRCANGLLVATDGQPPLPITSLELSLFDAFVPEADDGIKLIGWDETAELMVRTTVEVRHAGTVEGARDVEARETGDSRKVELAVGPFVVETVDESTAFRIVCRAWDHDALSANDELGGIDETWDVDNEWGLRGQLAGAHESEGVGGDGTVRYRYNLSAPGIDASKVGAGQFRERLWWPFDNFTTARLDRDLFTATFEDVAAMADLSVKDALVELFFNVAFAPAAKGGNCYGMSREGLLGLAGRAPWRPPLSRYGPPGQPFVEEADLDPVLKRAFNSSQGSQLGAALVAHLLRSIASATVIRPEVVFEQVRVSEAAGVPMVLSMYNWGAGEGHAVVAYAAEEVDRRIKRILVADPNTPSFAAGERDWTAAEASRIDIVGDGGYSWQYFQQGGQPHAHFAGPLGPHGPVTLMAIPPSVIFAPVRTPLDALGFLNWLPGGLILLGGATTSALSFGAEPPTFAASHVQTLSGLRGCEGSERGSGDSWLNHLQLEEMFGPSQAAAPGLFRLPLMDVGLEVFSRIGRFPDTFVHTFAGRGPGAVAWQAATDRHQYAISADAGGAEAITVDLQALQSIRPRLALTGDGGTRELTVHFRASEPGLPDLRTVLPVGAGITSRLDAMLPGRGVQVSPGADVSSQVIDLIDAGGGSSPVRIGAVLAGTTLLVQPRDVTSPLSTQVVSRLGPDGALLDRVEVAPTR